MVLTQPTSVSAIETEFGFSGNATKTLSNDLGLVSDALSKRLGAVGV